MTRTTIRTSLQLLGLFAITVAFLVESGVPSVSAATPITFKVMGTVTFVSPALAGTFAIGQPYTTIYTFDPATPDVTASANRGDYTGAITKMSVSVGPYQASGTASDFSFSGITVFDNLVGIDFYQAFVQGLQGPDVAGNLLDGFADARTEDLTQSAVSSDALPATPPDPVDYAVRFQQLRFQGPSLGFTVFGSIDSIRVLSVTSVGGVTSFSGGSGSSSGSIVLLAGTGAVVVAIATLGGWYNRRRWLGRRS